jgi:DNA repair photolyase
MDYKSINCDSILKRIMKTDSLFHGDYCIDPYQYCEFGCEYCDSSFENTIYIKKNIIDVLKKELASMQTGRIIIGSVHDPYQNAEKDYQLTKHVLETIKDYNFSCHILTKSPLIIRDIDLITKLNCIVTISILSLNDQVVRIFEPAAPSPADRMQTLEKLRNNNIKAGIAFIPLLPYITDSELESMFQAAQRIGAQYLLHKHLELKGDQKQHFKNLIKMHYPHLLSRYDALYEHNIKPDDTYIKKLDNTLSQYHKTYNIPSKIPL